MRLALITIALAALSAPAIASDLPSARPASIARQGDMLRDSNNVRIGSIDAVNKDGSVGVIYNSRYVTVPGDTLSLVNGKLTTKLTSAQVGSL